MDTCVCMDIDSSEQATPFSALFRTARKTHICCECGQEIKPGEKYEQANGCWDGDWSSYKTCATCRSIRATLFSCGYYFTELRQTIREYYGMDYITGELCGEEDEWEEREKWHIKGSE